MIDRRRFLGAASAAAAAGVSRLAFAQPSNVFFWSGFPVGGLGDQVTRPLLERMRGRYPGNLILDSKPGAGGRIAADFVKRQAPDGGNFFVSPTSPVTLYPHTYGKKLTYDPLVDFVPVAPIAMYTFSMTAGPGLPATVRTVSEFVAWARANPSLANYGIPAAGSVPHFVGMMLERESKAALASVPFKGGAPLLQDLIGGQIPVSFNVVSEVLPHIQSGKLRALAVTSPQRWPALPEVPTLAEQGYPELTFVEFLGIYAPAKTSPDIVRRLNAAVQQGLQTPEMQDVFKRTSLQPVFESPEAFAARVRNEIQRWGPIVKTTGFTPED